jgi:hypothetical protein
MAKFGEDGLVPDRLFEKASVDSSLDSIWFSHVHDFGILWLKVRLWIQWLSYVIIIFRILPILMSNMAIWRVYIYHPWRPYSHIFLCKLWVLPVILIYLENPYDGKICNRVGRAGNFKWQICFELSPGPTPCGKSTSKSNIAKYRRTY